MQKKLSKLGDVYVNDAFGTAHRAHASTAVIAEFFKDKLAGYLMESELTNADKVLGNPERPYTAIMGGAKIADKILIIERLLEKVDNLIIGGGMSYTFSKAQGGTIGNSLLEPDKIDFVLELMKKAKAKGVNLILPVDTVIADEFSNTANQGMAKKMARFLMAGWDWISGQKPENYSERPFWNPRLSFGMVQWVYLKWSHLTKEPKQSLSMWLKLPATVPSR